MKLGRYANDPLVKRLNELSESATPGPWQAAPKRLTVPLSDGTVAQGPLMSYLVGYQGSPEWLTVSLVSERHADHHFVVALVNAWRAGVLYAVAGSDVPLEPQSDAK